MNKALEKALKAAGWNVGDAADFLGMGNEQRKLLDLRMEIAQAIRTRRSEMKLSQQNLADRLKSTQSRVSLIEAADPDVSLDQLAKALIALGGTIRVEADHAETKSTKARSSSSFRKLAK